MSEKVSAEALMRRYSLSDHVENGSFIERHYLHEGEGRPASGSIYYYVSPDEYTKFHHIDCDEYWCYITGTPLDIWQLSPDGELSITRLGIEEDCVPLVYLKKGVRFGSRHSIGVQEGTFLSCITVPRFQDAGFTLCEDEEILRECPETAEFFKM